MYNITAGEKHTLRELAVRCAELASLPAQAERRGQARQVNGKFDKMGGNR